MTHLASIFLLSKVEGLLFFNPSTKGVFLLKRLKNKTAIYVGGSYFNYYEDNNYFQNNWISENCLKSEKDPNLINHFELFRLLKKNNIKFSKKNQNGLLQVYIFFKESAIWLKFHSWHHAVLKENSTYTGSNFEDFVNKIFYYKKQFIFNIINNSKKF